jgi:endoglucanase
MIVPHNYGRYYGKVITDVPGFQAYWKTLAAAFKSDSKVIFDTNNECNIVVLLFFL